MKQALSQSVRARGSQSVTGRVASDLVKIRKAPETGRVARFVLEPPIQGRLDRTPQDHIREAITTGVRVERYGRIWIVGRVSLEEDILFGRIGYQQSVGSTVEVWDDEEQDFAEIAVPAGLATPFAIDLSGLRLAFQPRPPQIRIGAVTGAFRAMLNEPDQSWTISSLARTVTLEEWLASVVRVSHFRLRVRRPNPHWEDTPDLEALMEGMEAQVAVLEARSDDGVNVETPFVRQTLQHIGAGYGDARLTGVRQEESGEHETVYDTEIGTEEQATEAPTNPETGEVLRESLQQALAVGDDGGETD